MPGRRVSRQKTSRKPERTGNSKRRSLDALALAEQEVPIEAQIRKNRVRDLVDGTAAQQQSPLLEVAPESEETDRAPKRQKIVHESTPASGSGDEGVADDLDFRIGEVDSEDDSSVNSDEAFGDGDDEAFRNFKFHGSSDLQAAPPVEFDHAPDLETLATYRRLAGAHADIQYDASRNARSISKGNDYEDDSESRLSADFEDQADSVMSMSDVDDATADPQNLAKLQALAASLSKEQEADSSARFGTDSAQEAATPSEYGIKPRQRLSVADLLPTVTDPQARKALRMMIDDGKRSKGSAPGVPGRLDVPLAKRKQDRLDRAAAYEKSKETLSRWIETVKRNRRAEHLVFPLPDADESSSKNTRRLPPTATSKPITDLEGTIKNILVESGMVAATDRSQDNQIQEAEQLVANRLPLEEIQAKRAELRRHRDLLFREEIRAKRIKKIKSKAYRRVHRKERERNLLREKEALAAAGIVPEGEEERLDRMRAEERMSGRHRESKWAKSLKGFGRQAWDEEARSELTEMARRNEELRKRIQGKNVQNDGESSQSDSDSEDSLNGERPERHSHGLVEKLKDLKSGDAPAAITQLSSLKFMQKADAAQKAQNDAEIEKIRQDLNGEPTREDDTSGIPATGRRRYGPIPSEERASMKKKAPANEFEEGQGSDDEAEGGEEDEEMVQIITERSAHAGDTGAGATDLTKNTSKRTGQPQKSLGPVGNPWLALSSNAKESGSRAADDSIVVVNKLDAEPNDRTIRIVSQSMPAGKRSTPSLEIPAANPTEHSQELLAEQSDTDADSSFNGFSSPGSPRSSDANCVQKNQDLIRRAFASDDVLAASNFAAEKAALAKDDSDDQDDAVGAPNSSLPGWGSWTGAGLPKRDRKKPPGPSATKTGRLAQQTAEKRSRDKQPRQDQGLANVMISQKRVPKKARFLATALPRPYETRAQYERSLRLPVGREWVAGETFRQMVRPRVETKAGEVVQAMSRPTV